MKNNFKQKIIQLDNVLYTSRGFFEDAKAKFALNNIENKLLYKKNILSFQLIEIFQQIVDQNRKLAEQRKKIFKNNCELENQIYQIKSKQKSVTSKKTNTQRSQNQNNMFKIDFKSRNTNPQQTLKYKKLLNATKEKQKNTNRYKVQFQKSHRKSCSTFVNSQIHSKNTSCFDMKNQNYQRKSKKLRNTQLVHIKTQELENNNLQILGKTQLLQQLNTEHSNTNKFRASNNYIMKVNLLKPQQRQAQVKQSLQNISYPICHIPIFIRNKVKVQKFEDIEVKIKITKQDNRRLKSQLFRN